MIPALIGVTVITFAIIHLTPGGFTKANMQMDPRISPDSIARLKSLYGLDLPLHEQYLNWLKRMARLDFGSSFIDNRPVLEKIVERLPATLLLNVCAMALIIFFGIVIGATSAASRNSLYDHFMTLFTFAGYSMPSFWLALLLMMIFGVQLGWLPVSGMRSLNYDGLGFFEKMLDIASHMILPVFVTAFGGIAYISRYIKNSMIETMSQQYIRAAYAKGLPERTVIYRSALKNSLLPMITILGLSVPGLIGGSFIFETIFSWPGMGRLAYESAMAFDYPVIMGVVTIGALLTMAGNLCADVAYAAVDPRIRYR